MRAALIILSYAVATVIMISVEEFGDWRVWFFGIFPLTHLALGFAIGRWRAVALAVVYVAVVVAIGRSRDECLDGDCEFAFLLGVYAPYAAICLAIGVGVRYGARIAVGSGRHDE